jgi:chromosome segregation ATPase
LDRTNFGEKGFRPLARDNKRPHIVKLNVTRDKAEQTTTGAAIKVESEHPSLHQDHWKKMHRATGQISFFTGQVNGGDDEELRQLRDYHDRTRLLEGEHRDLQRRFDDQETKLANLGRTVATVRQTLAQAHQRAVGLEKQAKETVAELGSIRNQLEEASHAETQLDSEFSLLKLQLREMEADERLTRVSRILRG